MGDGVEMEGGEKNLVEFEEHEAVTFYKYGGGGGGDVVQPVFFYLYIFFLL